MPTTVNYSSLIADLQVYLERGGSATTDPTVFNQLPRLINAAERDCANFLKLQGQIEFLTSLPPNGFQQGNPVIAKPDRWRQTVSMNYGTGPGNNTVTQLFPRSYEYCLAYWPNISSYDPATPPEFYADMDLNHWLISPTPPVAAPFQAVCYMQPPLLDETTQSNFWTIWTPNLLLFSSLLQAEPFLKDDPRIPVWKQMQQEQIQMLVAQDLGKILDRSSQRKNP
jgi:hypothetical protein